VLERDGPVTLKIEAAGVPNATYLLETSPDIVTWTQQRSVILDAAGLAQFNEAFGPANPPRFYRLRAL
jgi:hypothetical protein